MSHEEVDQFIDQKLQKSGLELTYEEVREIKAEILDESRFPRREPPKM